MTEVLAFIHTKAPALLVLTLGFGAWVFIPAGELYFLPNAEDPSFNIRSALLFVFLILGALSVDVLVSLWQRSSNAHAKRWILRCVAGIAATAALITVISWIGVSSEPSIKFRVTPGTSLIKYDYSTFERLQLSQATGPWVITDVSIPNDLGSTRIAISNEGPAKVNIKPEDNDAEALLSALANAIRAGITMEVATKKCEIKAEMSSIECAVDEDAIRAALEAPEWESGAPPETTEKVEDPNLPRPVMLIPSPGNSYVSYSIPLFEKGGYTASVRQWRVKSAAVGAYSNGDYRSGSHILLDHEGPFNVFLEGASPEAEVMLVALAQAINTGCTIEIKREWCDVWAGEKRITCKVGERQIISLLESPEWAKMQHAASDADAAKNVSAIDAKP